MSNAERSRRFREAHPGYHARIQARKRASTKAGVAKFLAEYPAMLAAAEAAQREPLMLPAPVELLELPGLNAIPAKMPAREAVAVTCEAA